jgi:hypothetical protein
MNSHLPSVQALWASDERVLQRELRCLAAREQASVVRSLAEQVEALAPGGEGPLHARLVEELGLLGLRIVEVAASLSESGRDHAP